VAELLYQHQFCPHHAEVIETTFASNMVTGSVQEFGNFEANVESFASNASNSCFEVVEESGSLLWTEVETMCV